uniref:CCR4-NOT transcription complex subunit 1 n=1 Tax=Panagrolaimus sp. JU765 TaxID=591449 RepID=A0AC34Q1M4_9BILA
MAGSTGRIFKANFHAVLSEHGRSFTDSVERCVNLILTAAENNADVIDSNFAADLIIAILAHNRAEFISDVYDENFWLPSDDEILAAQLHSSVFIAALLQINPKINAGEILSYFKNSSAFIVRDKAGVYFVTKCIAQLCSPNYFPVDELHQLWPSNKIGELSWIGQLLLNPDLLCLGDFAVHRLNTSCLKVPPDETNKEIRNWVSLDLQNVLLDLANDYEKLVVDIIAKKHDHLVGHDSRPLVPATHCPELLILGCIQLAKPLNTFRSLLLRQLVVQLMLIQTNAVPVLNALWTTDVFAVGNEVQQIVVDALALFYKLGPEDAAPMRLTRILEVAHELKPNGLGELFNVNQFDFAIDLACLAARRDFLKLDKFLEDKLTEHSELFAQHLVQYIRQRYPGIPGQGLSTDTVETMHKALYLKAAYSPAIDIELNRLTAYMRQLTTKPFEPQFVSRTPNMYGNQAPTPNLFLYGRNGDASPGHLAGNGSMTTPLYGANQRPMGTSTPTYSYTPNMDIRNSMSDSLYRGTMTTAPPPGWGSGWSQRSTPVPGNTPMDFRPSFVQSGSLVQNQSMASFMSADSQSQDQVFSDDIQDEANSFFQRMFTDSNQLPVSEFIRQMAAFRNSNNQREKDVLNCVIKNLFDEFKFFNEYPEYELKTTAEIYGGFINEGIVQNLEFATAVRRVIEAVHSRPESQLFTFGIVALEACKSVLHRYPKVCIMMRENDSFVRFPQSLKEYVIAGCEGRLPPDNSAYQTVAAVVQETMTRTDSIKGAMITVANMDILEKGTEQDGKTIVFNDESVVEEVSFMFNNLSTSNLQQKIEDMQRLLDSQEDNFRQWFAQYLVMKRVTLEQNFHTLYDAFLRGIDDEKLYDYVKQETLRNIKILLKSDKKHAASNFTDRQLLKNLGHWLGLITIARNRPIGLDELNLRDLLLEAFYKGQQELLFVIPFITKVVISSKASIAFTPASAWIGLILRVLAEIHRQSDLKLNLKFEIEVLCKELHVTLESLGDDSCMLQDTERITRMTQQLSEVEMLTRPDMQPQMPEMMPGVFDPTGRTSALHTSLYNQQATPDIEATPSTSYQPPSGSQALSVPSFYYTDVNVHEGVEHMVQISSQFSLCQMIPSLAAQLRSVVAQAVRENISGLVERSVSVALSLTTDIIMKDFAFISNEQQFRRAYLQMMRSMTAAITMITTREPLASTIAQYVRQVVTQHAQAYIHGPDYGRMLEEVVVGVLEQNIEFTSCYVVKMACEKAAIEIEKRMDENFKRKAEIDMEIYSVPPDVQAIIDRMPPDLRPRNRNLTDPELQVYDLFTNQICGFKPSVIEDLFCDFVRPRGDIYPVVIADPENLNKYLTAFAKTSITNFVNRNVVPNTDLYNCCVDMRQALMDFVYHGTYQYLFPMVDRLTENFLASYLGTQDARLQVAASLDRTMLTYGDLFVAIVNKIMSHVDRIEIVRMITRFVVSTIKERQFLNPDAHEILIRHRYVNLTIYDQLMCRYVENMDPIMISFVQKMFRILQSNETRRSSLSAYLPTTIDQLKSIIRSHSKKDSREFGLSNLTSASANIAPYESRMPVGPAAAYAMETRQDATFSDDLLGYREPMAPPSDYQSKAEVILREWMTIYYSNETSVRAGHGYNIVVGLIQNHGIPITEESILKFFKTCLDLCLDVSYRLLRDNNNSLGARQRCYHTLDAFTKIICILIKSGDQITGSGKIALLHKCLESFNNSLVHDHEYRRSEFSGFPFYRILHIMLVELCTGPTAMREHKWNVLEAVGHAMYYIQPRRAPAFAYHWLDIVGHRQFISLLLADPNAPPLTRAIYTQLIVALLKFLAPSLRNVKMSKAVQDLYKGTLRVMLVILHDFPELLCEYYFILCDVIPPNCVQLRNLVLSAYPRNMRLPDPFGQTFEQIEILPEMDQMPKIPFEMFNLIPDDVRTQLDAYLTSRNCVTFLSDLANNLETSQNGVKYNIPVLNAIVSYVGVRAIQQIKEAQQPISISTISHSAYMDVYQSLAISFCTQGRYLLFNALANQLRYPNAQTHYFACTLLYLFSESKDDQIKEQITRVLFERLVSMRPHPWGLLITFIELIRNEHYNFWQYEFVHCAPEIERLFASVAGSCNVNLPTKFGSVDNAPGSI